MKFKNIILILFVGLCFIKPTFSQNTCDCVANTTAYRPYNINVVGSESSYILTGMVDNPSACTIILNLFSVQVKINNDGNPQSTATIQVPASTSGFKFSVILSLPMSNSVAINYYTKTTVSNNQCSSSNFSVLIPEDCKVKINNGNSYVNASGTNPVYSTQEITLNNTGNIDKWVRFFGPSECTVTQQWYYLEAGQTINVIVTFTKTSNNLAKPFSLFYQIYDFSKTKMCDYKNLKVNWQ